MQHPVINRAVVIRSQRCTIEGKNISHALFQQFAIVAAIAVLTMAVQFPGNPTSDMSADEKSSPKENKTVEQSDESGHEIETELEEKDKKFLDDAMQTILDPHSIIVKNNDEIESFKMKLEQMDKENITLDTFMEEMDKLSLDICKTSQQALWSYVTDINNEGKKNRMVCIFFLHKNNYPHICQYSRLLQGIGIEIVLITLFRRVVDHNDQIENAIAHFVVLYL